MRLCLIIDIDENVVFICTNITDVSALKTIYTLALPLKIDLNIY